MTIWVARAGKNGEQEDRALKEKRAFIGWSELKDLSELVTRAEILEHLQETYSYIPGIKKSRWARNSAGQLFTFSKCFKIGDLFALPLKKKKEGEERAIAFGQVSGDYEFMYDNSKYAGHSRRVKWICKSIPRSAFGQDIRSFNCPLTVFGVGRNDAEKRERIVKVINSYRK